MNRIIEINDRKIGPGQSVYIVAELSANHGQDFDLAVAMVRAAADAGADAVKIQTYKPDTITIDCDNEHFRIGEGTVWAGRTLYDLYREAYTPWEWQPHLKEIAEESGVDLFSTPFDSTAVDFLEEMDIPCYKIASFEIVDLPLIRRVAATGKPIIFSTGMATMEEIDEAVSTAREAGARQLCLLKCTSAYPASPETMNLRAIPHMMEEFDVVAGLSDHTLSLVVPVTAVALGASVIEKHFILDRVQEGPDSTFSLEPHDFRVMVESVRTVEKALGAVSYGMVNAEKASLVFRRSLFVVEDMVEGEEFTDENVSSIRPGMGLHPRYLDDVKGEHAKVAIKRGTPLTWNLVNR